MSNKLDLRKTVGELSRAYPELPGILRELGLPEVGTEVTIPRRAALGGIGMVRVLAGLRSRGFEIGAGPLPPDPPVPPAPPAVPREAEKTEEPEGFDTPELPEDPLAAAAAAARARDEAFSSAVSALPEGHPVRVFLAENARLRVLIADAKAAAVLPCGSDRLLEKARALRCLSGHYDRKGDLVYPLLNRGYGFGAPAGMLWELDDDIRAALTRLCREGDTLPDLAAQLTEVAARADDMIHKEQTVLFPLCLRTFTTEDWMRVYYDSPSYPTVLDTWPVWVQAEANRAELCRPREGIRDGRIGLGRGSMTAEEIRAALDALPMELTFVDQDDINRYFNSGNKLFARPDMALDRDVYACHPPKVEAMVRRIIERFRAGDESSVEMWSEKAGEPVLIRYLALRDGAGTYLGTLECVQKMGFAREHFEK